MAEESPGSPFLPEFARVERSAPLARLELRHGTNRPLLYDVFETGFVIGAVAGCDLRLPGADLPPLLCLIAPRAEGLGIRKLVPTFHMEINDQVFSEARLANDDHITIGPVELRVQWVDAASAHGPVNREVEAQGEASAVEPAPLRTEHENIRARQQRLREQQRELYQRYRERRDRLAGLQEAVTVASRKVQEAKRQHAEEVAAAMRAREADEARRLELAERASDLDQRDQDLRAANERVAVAELEVRDRGRALNDRQQELQRHENGLRVEQQQRERAIRESLQGLEQRERQYQDDLVQLHRLAASLEERRQQLQERADDTDRRAQELERDARELEAQALQLTACRDDHQRYTDQLAQEKADLDRRHAELDQRAKAMDEQQTALAALRARWEAQCERLQRDEQDLVHRRRLVEEDEARVRYQGEELRRAQDQADAELRRHQAEYTCFDEHRAAIEAAFDHLSRCSAHQAAETAKLDARAIELERQALTLAERTAHLDAQAAELKQRQESLNLERQAVRDRETAMAQEERGREALQEQLRRRSEELAERLRVLGEKEKSHASAEASRAAEIAEWEAARQRIEEQWTAREQQVAAAQVDVLMREQRCQRTMDRVRHVGKLVAQARKRTRIEQARLAEEQRGAAKAVATSRNESESIRQSAATLQQQLVGWQANADAVAEHVQRVREQLRGHLAEINEYARRVQDDLESTRSQVRFEAEKVRDQSVAVHRARDEHRAAVTSFRQQLIDWQAQIAEMKRSLSQDQERLEQRHAEVEATSVQLAEKAEQLQAEARAVTERRDVMDRHLAEMRQWYRRKLRELGERFDSGHGTGRIKAQVSEPDRPIAARILALTDADPGDRKLGDLLRSLELIDADTLASLLVEARKQRQTLRQVLLASGYVTLYQLALIEAGNLDSLVLGPVRVLERLYATAHETVYRVFDPRSTPNSAGGEAVLRHLAEPEMEDAVRPDEFRQRFAAATRVRHANLASTLEVLEIEQRPAALLEAVSGLAASDWPPLCSVPGVWLRLVQQCAQGLHAAHQAGLYHGHLHPSLVLMNPTGVLKIVGFGEPLWLADPGTLVPDGEMTVNDDLRTLARMAQTWATALPARRSTGRSRPIAEPLAAILEKLNAAAPHTAYHSAADLLEDLDRAAATIPANPDAWDRFVSETHRDVSIRQSA